jgi:hypothetical protein
LGLFALESAWRILSYYSGLSDDLNRNATYYVHEMPCSMDLLVENGLDPSHFPFAHHGVISKRSDAAPMSITVKTSNFTHLDLETSYTRKGQQRERLYSFQRPTLLCTQEKDAFQNWQQSSKFFIVPVREGRSRILTSVEKLSKSWLPDWITHLATGRLFEGDYFLHYAELAKASGKSYMEASSADQGPRAWTKWWKQFGMANAPPHTFGGASNRLTSLSRRDLHDAWVIHTSTCSKCRSVLKRAKRVQFWSIVVGLVGAWSVQQRQRKPALVMTTTLLASLGLVASWISKKLVHLLEGSPHASDVPERSFSMNLN